MQTILATGATGLVGSRFVEMFADKYEVINMDLTTGVDITRPETFAPFITKHPDAKFLIHLAAFTDTNQAFAQSGDKEGICYKVNVDGTKNVVDVCKEHGIHLIHVSTDFVFDGKKETAYTEEDPTSPIEWYGETKAMAEEVVKNSGASYTIIRLSYPYRATYDLKPDLVKKIRAGLESGKLYPQFSDSLITPTFIDDIATALDKIIEKKPQGILHIVGSDSMSPYILAQKVATAYGFDPSIVKQGSLEEYLKTAARPFAKTVAMSNQKASQVLGLHFATIDEGLAEVKKQQGL
ncbi:SDR family oxidoreductase [Candidatus Woesebacteria bacterium]|nr:SDR family oxidoreductase [Candidatus Woesebacteria bacterium]